MSTEGWGLHYPESCLSTDSTEKLPRTILHLHEILLKTIAYIPYNESRKLVSQCTNTVESTKALLQLFTSNWQLVAAYISIAVL